MTAVDSLPTASFVFGTFSESDVLTEAVLRVDAEWQTRFNELMASTSAALYAERLACGSVTAKLEASRVEIADLKRKLEDAAVLQAAAAAEVERLTAEVASQREAQAVSTALEDALKSSAEACELQSVVCEAKASLDRERLGRGEAETALKTAREQIESLKRSAAEDALKAKQAASAERLAFQAQLKTLRKELDEERLLNKAAADVKVEILNGPPTPKQQTSRSLDNDCKTARRLSSQLKETTEMLDRLRSSSVAMLRSLKTNMEDGARLVALKHYVKTHVDALSKSMQEAAMDDSFDTVIIMANELCCSFLQHQDHVDLMEEAAHKYMTSLVTGKTGTLHGVEAPTPDALLAYNAMCDVLKISNMPQY